METICLNLTPTGAHPVCHVSKCDVGRYIQVLLFDDDLPYTIKDGDSLTLQVLKPNHENVAISLNVTVGETHSYIVTEEEICDIAGRNLCELVLKNGEKNIGSLNFYMQVEEIVGDIEPLPPPTPVVVEPVIKGFYARNARTEGALSHTFTEGGTYQFMVMIRCGEPYNVYNPVITLNDDVIIPTIYEVSEYLKYFYGEITVNAGDVLTATQVGTYAQGTPFHFVVFENANMSDFRYINQVPNGQPAFILPNNVWILQWYKCGYYNGNNNYQYRLEYHVINQDSLDNNHVQSIPTPSDPMYWYGFTMAVVILGGE